MKVINHVNRLQHRRNDLPSLIPRVRVLTGHSSMDESKAKILTDDEIRALGRKLSQALPASAVESAVQSGLNAETAIRLSSLTLRLREECEMGSLSVKDVSDRLKVPQYKIRNIEQGEVRKIDPAVLAQYCSFLGLNEWCQSWASTNPELAGRLGLPWGKDAGS